MRRTSLARSKRPLIARKRRVKRKKVPGSRSDLIKQLDASFSKFIKKKYGSKCYTCNGNGNQCGHYISRSVYALRWEENNARPQCAGCNVFKHGNVVEYRIRLVEELGEKAVKALENRRNELFKADTAWLKMKLEEFSS